MDHAARIYVAGQQGLVGAALVRELLQQGYANLIGRDGEPDLTDARAVEAFFDWAKPEYVVVAAGKSGGIEANRRYPAEFMRSNLLVACHLIESAHRHRVTKLLYLGSSCSYPKLCPQPMRVESLQTGPMEPTNEAYATAKLAGMMMVQAYRRQYRVRFIAGIPGDAFGPGDDFHPEHSHVIAALIRRMHEAKAEGLARVDIWGTGTPRRGFIFVDDLANACLFVLREYDGDAPINISGPWDLSIREAAEMVKEVVGYAGSLRFDPSKPDGMPVKVLETSPLRAMGWSPTMDFRAAVAATYAWFLEREASSIRRKHVADTAVSGELRAH